MKISDIMTEKNVVLGLKANSKRQLLQELSDKAAEITGINERTIFDIVLERENLAARTHPRARQSLRPVCKIKRARRF